MLEALSILQDNFIAWLKPLPVETTCAIVNFVGKVGEKTNLNDN